MKMSSNIEVKTVSGKVLPRIKCRFINNSYYEIDVDCFLMQDGKWHRKNNGKIEFDHEFGKYVLIEQSSMLNGIIGFAKNGNPEIGYFSANPAKNVEVFTKQYGTLKCINEDLPLMGGYKECVSSGIFYPNDAAINFTKKNIDNRYSFNLEYSSAPKLKVFGGSHAENYKKQNNIVSPFFKELGATSFGFEFETENGFIPERHLFRNGLIPLRDGSLRHDGIEPYEYTTIPLRGENGVSTLIDDVALLQKHTTIGHRCALHLHLGGFESTKELVIAMHKVMIRIQDEVYSMFPPNYKFTSQNGFKSKDYCAPIKNIKFAKTDTIDMKFDRLLTHYAGGPYNFRGFNRENHPMDRSNEHKWNVNLRYYLLNSIPFIWGPTGTFEFRVHQPSHNLDKIINWLFICNAIVRFADNHKLEIVTDSYNMKPANLDFILNDVYSKDLATILSAYCEERKALVEKMAVTMNDVIGDYELKHDLDKVKNSIL